MMYENVTHSFFDGMHGKISYYSCAKYDPDALMFIFLSGFSVTETYLDFKNTAKRLDKYGNMVFIDLLGRGKSSETDAPRTIGNIINELDELIASLNVKEMIFVSHSLGGVYAKKYIDDHPDKIRSAIFFEPTTAEGEHLFNTSKPYIENRERLESLTEEERAQEFFDDEWTAEDIASMKQTEERLTQLFNNGNSTLYHEWQLLKENLAKATKQPLRSDFENLIISQPFREKEYADSEYANTKTKLSLISGNHYLHRVRKKEAAEAVFTYLDYLKISDQSQ